MEIEQLEQIAAVIVTAGLVAGNFLMFTPWRNGVDPRQRRPQSLMPQNESVVSDRAEAYAMQASHRSANSKHSPLDTQTTKRLSPS